MPTQTPGVESTTRSVLGTSSAPAQWPDCCRLVETIFIRLCTIHPSPKRQGNAVEMVSDPPRLQKDKAACTGQQLGDGRNLNAAGGG